MDRPSYLWSLLTFKCPRCRRGKMFGNNNPWNLKKTLAMPERCPVCRQPFELEPGFYYGTGYVSYALSVMYLVITFILWWVLIGFSVNDDRFFWWMGFAVVSLILLQPWLMRLSRVVYIYFFVRYNENYKTDPVVKFDN
jgi:hypothetical protein